MDFRTSFCTRSKVTESRIYSSASLRERAAFELKIPSNGIIHPSSGRFLFNSDTIRGTWKQEFIDNSLYVTSPRTMNSWAFGSLNRIYSSTCRRRVAITIKMLRHESRRWLCDRFALPQLGSSVPMRQAHNPHKVTKYRRNFHWVHSLHRSADNWLLWLLSSGLNAERKKVRQHNSWFSWCEAK